MMDKFEILRVLEMHGFKAYIVGGYVRDHLLSIESSDVDITTSARPKDVLKLFPDGREVGLGCVNFKNATENIDITTFRREFSYLKRHPSNIEYIGDLEEDLKRRDFTINAICMDKDTNILDPFGGVKDLKDRTIKMVGDVDTKLSEDPLRMLRAVRFSIIYDFTIDEEIVRFIEKNKSAIKNLSFARKREELDKILSSKRALEGLCMIRELGLLQVLSIDYDESFKRTENILGCWAQLDFNEAYPFSRIERKKIEEVRKIVEESHIMPYTLLECDIESVKTAGEILNISCADIEKMRRSMRFSDKRDLAVDGNAIKKLVGDEHIKEIDDIKKDLINQILSGNLPNSVEHLEEYILKRWK